MANPLRATSPLRRSPAGALRLLALLPVLAVLHACAPNGAGSQSYPSASSAASPPADPLDAYLRSRDPFGGVVLVREGGRTVLHRAYDDADRELGVPLTTEHIVRIGSLTKPFTAQAVLLLEEQGRLDLGDSVCRFVRECPPAWEPVTIRHLLGHTSGIPDLFGALGAVPVEETRAEIDRVLGSGVESAPRTEPGTSYAYSNFGYMLLGYVIEEASGASWEDFLVRHVFDPLGMDRTRYDDVWEIVPGRAHGYQVKTGAVAPIEYDDHAAFAAGGLRSTTGDIGRWAEAFFSGRIVDEENLGASLTPGPGDYGLGWQVTRFFDRTVYNHTGGIDGFSSHLAWYPADSLLVVVLANLEDADARGTACDLAALRFGADHVPLTERRPVDPLPEALAGLAGDYEVEGDARGVTIGADDEGLFYRRGDGGELRVLAIGGGLFVIEAAPDILVRFERAEPDAPAEAVRLVRCGAVLVEARR